MSFSPRASPRRKLPLCRVPWARGSLTPRSICRRGATSGCGILSRCRRRLRRKVVFLAWCSLSCGIVAPAGVESSWDFPDAGRGELPDRTRSAQLGGPAEVPGRTSTEGRWHTRNCRRSSQPRRSASCRIRTPAGRRYRCSSTWG